MSETNEISSPSDKEHIAPCGLFCTNCRRFMKNSCKGCQIAPGFSQCKIRKCCIDKGIAICSDCQEFSDYNECKKINNFIAKIFKFIFGSDRPKALTFIREKGREEFIKEKAQNGKM